MFIWFVSFTFISVVIMGGLLICIYKLVSNYWCHDVVIHDPNIRYKIIIIIIISILGL